MSDPATFHTALANETATGQLMADLALLLGAGDVITLSGDLGAGKTAAARALIRYLAQDDELEVPSPTFTLAQTYDLPPFPLLHAVCIGSLILMNWKKSGCHRSRKALSR
jgi:tRNA A37 threonylcarbamoyladenosine biosynthesis protein TsaE